MDKVKMYDSNSIVSGVGFICSHCTYISIENSIFKNLVSSGSEGGAILIYDLSSPNDENPSYIRDSRFERNQAVRGGALLLDRLKLIQISDN